jgi:type IV secretion system protein TrbC
MGSRLTSANVARHQDAEGSFTDPDQLDLDIHAAPRRDRNGSASERGVRASIRDTGTNERSTRLMLLAMGVMGALAGSASPAWAAGAGAATMPWDGPLQALVNNLTGTTARALVLIAVVGAGLLWAFTRNEEGLKKLGQITFGGAIALGAATLMASLGFAGATF